MSRRELTAPEGDDEILDFEDEALRLKPAMTGDVFRAVSVPGEARPIDVMVAGHPCTIRKGARLKDRVPCVRLVDHQWVPYRNWPDGHHNYFPLSREVGLGHGRCAALDDWVTVDSSELPRDRRKLTLQNQGILIFQQRLIHSLSRFAPPVNSLKDASWHVLVEAELEYDWVFELESQAPLETLIDEFGTFMDADGRRDGLKQDERRIRSAVKEQIRQRQH